MEPPDAVQGVLVGVVHLRPCRGESEQQVSRRFARARQVAPTVIFIDEIDSLAPVRGGGLGEPAVTERVVNTILAEMDGLEEMQGVVVIAATNRPNLVDPALLRPGRFDELIYVPVPDAAGRRHILGIHTKNMPLAEDVDLDSLAERTSRFTGADLEDLTRRAGLLVPVVEGTASSMAEPYCGPHLRLPPGRLAVVGQQRVRRARQPDRLRGEVDAHELRPARRRAPLGEDEVPPPRP